MDQSLRLSDLAAEGLDDGLVAEADAERRDVLPEPFDDLEAHAGVFRAPRPGEITRWRRARALRLVGIDLVVSDDLHLGAELLEEVREVVREAVVVVDQQDHASASLQRGLQRCQLTQALLVLRGGSESATMPAPACSRARPSSSTTVRMAMHVSKAPPGSA